MRSYETLFILNPDLEEETISQLVDKFKNIIEENGGSITELDEWGRRKLAYKVKKFTEGYYVLIKFNGEPRTAQDLERVFKITDGVLKYLIVKDEEIEVKS